MIAVEIRWIFAPLFLLLFIAGAITPTFRPSLVDRALASSLHFCVLDNSNKDGRYTTSVTKGGSLISTPLVKEGGGDDVEVVGDIRAYPSRASVARHTSFKAKTCETREGLSRQVDKGFTSFCRRWDVVVGKFLLG